LRKFGRYYVTRARTFVRALWSRKFDPVRSALSETTSTPTLIIQRMVRGVNAPSLISGELDAGGT
jgi:hypothetical protein